MIKKLLLAVLTLFSFCAHAQNFVASYGFANVTTTSGTLDPTPLPSVTGVSFSPFSAAGSFSNPNAATRFSFIGWPAGATDGIDTYSTFTGAPSPTVYYEVSFSPQSNYSVTLNSLVFSMRRSSTGVRNYAVRSSADSYSANLSASVGSNTKISVVSPNIFFWSFDATSNSADQKGNTITFSGPAFTNFTNTVTFRFYAWNAEGSSGTFSIDSVVFNGSAYNTPPSPVSVLTQRAVEGQLSVFPNPSRDGIVTISAPADLSGIEIVNLVGDIVFACENKPYDSKLRLNNLPRGIYFLKARVGDSTYIKKFVLE